MELQEFRVFQGRLKDFPAAFKRFQNFRGLRFRVFEGHLGCFREIPGGLKRVQGLQNLFKKKKIAFQERIMTFKSSF